MILWPAGICILHQHLKYEDNRQNGTTVDIYKGNHIQTNLKLNFSPTIISNNTQNNKTKWQTALNTALLKWNGKQHWTHCLLFVKTRESTAPNEQHIKGTLASFCPSNKQNPWSTWKLKARVTTVCQLTDPSIVYA